MKYQIDEELKVLEKFKMPANIKLLPLMNLVMNVFQCKSDESVDVKKFQIPGYQDAAISVLVLEPKKVPKNAPEDLPCMVFFHGGGFMLKTSGGHFKLAKEYAAKLPCKVVYADYRLAPKYPFPVPAEDCYRTYQWTLENAERLKINREKIVIAGDSAGGNLAAAVTLMARDRELQIPKGLMLIYPVTDRRMNTESMKKYTDTPVWDANLSKMMWNAYLGDQIPEKIEYASPLEAVSYNKFPPSHIEVAEFDSLRDEGVLLYDRLKAEGIEVTLHEIKNACHGFETAINSRITRTCMETRMKWLREILDYPGMNRL